MYKMCSEVCLLYEMCSEVCLLHEAALHQPPAHCLPVACVCCCRMSGDVIPMQQGLSGRLLPQQLQLRSHSVKAEAARPTS